MWRSRHRENVGVETNQLHRPTYVINHRRAALQRRLHHSRTSGPTTCEDDGSGEIGAVPGHGGFLIHLPSVVCTRSPRDEEHKTGLSVNLRRDAVFCLWVRAPCRRSPRRLDAHHCSTPTRPGPDRTASSPATRSGLAGLPVSSSKSGRSFWVIVMRVMPSGTTSTSSPIAEAALCRALQHRAVRGQRRTEHRRLVFRRTRDPAARGRCDRRAWPTSDCVLSEIRQRQASGTMDRLWRRLEPIIVWNGFGEFEVSTMRRRR